MSDISYFSPTLSGPGREGEKNLTETNSFSNTEAGGLTAAELDLLSLCAPKHPSSSSPPASGQLLGRKRENHHRLCPLCVFVLIMQLSLSPHFLTCSF